MHKDYGNCIFSQRERRREVNIETPDIWVLNFNLKIREGIDVLLMFTPVKSPKPRIFCLNQPFSSDAELSLVLLVPPCRWPNPRDPDEFLEL